MNTTAIALAIERLVARARIVLTAAVTWLVLAATILGAIVSELELAGVGGTVVRILAGVLGALGVAIAIIRRVTTVLPDARGILPTGAPATDLEAIGVAAIRDAAAAGELVEQYPGEFA
jgi:hypothetical protein